MWWIWEEDDPHCVSFEGLLDHEIKLVDELCELDWRLLINTTSDLVGTCDQRLELRGHETADLVAQLILDQIRLNRQFVDQLYHELLESKSEHLSVFLILFEPVQVINLAMVVDLKGSSHSPGFVLDWNDEQVFGFVWDLSMLEDRILESVVI